MSVTRFKIKAEIQHNNDGRWHALGATDDRDIARAIVEYARKRIYTGLRVRYRILERWHDGSIHEVGS